MHFVDGWDKITNTGTIVGNIFFGGSNDIFDGTGGTQSGTIDGEDGDDALTGGVGNDIFHGGAGNDTLNGGAGNDILQGDAGNDTLDGGAGDDTAIFAGQHSDFTITKTGTGYRVTANSGDGGTDTLVNVEHIQFTDETLDLDTLVGGTGNDTLHGGAGTYTLDGGSGDDTATFAGRHSDFTVTKTGGGYRVTANSGDGGTVTLVNVEHIQFTDATLGLQYNDAVQELYISYFGRAADSTGLANFAAALAAANAPSDIQALNAAYRTNATVRSLIDSFGTSNESKALYAGDTKAFVTAVYTHVFNRAPLTEGLSFWSGAIDSGTLTKGNAALSIMAGAFANTTPQGLIDAALVNNKITVASNFTFAIDTSQEVQGYKGAAAAATVRDMLSTVTNATDSDAFQSTVSSTLASLSVQPSGMPKLNAVHEGDIFNDGQVEIVGVSHGNAGHLFV